LNGRQAFEPGDAQDADIEHGVVAEQHHMTAGAGRGEDRREEAAARAERCERLGVLQHREHGRQRRDQEQQDQRGFRRQHLIQAKRGEHGEVEHADAAALQRERIAGTFLRSASR
jgi:hypothetical protein